MNYSIETKSFVYSLVNNYCKYDNFSEQFNIHIDDIDQDDLHILCGRIMIENPESASESISIDNPEYKKLMLPALNAFMINPSESATFEEKWKKGVLSYFRKTIIELLDDAEEIYNQEMAA